MIYSPTKSRIRQSKKSYPHTCASVWVQNFSQYIITAYALLIGIMIFASSAFAGYEDMKKEIEVYEPPAYIQSLLKPEPEKQTETEETEFTDKKSSLEEMKVRWEQALEASHEGSNFIKPDKSRMKKIGNAASDDRAAARAIKGKFSLETLEILALLRNPGIKAAEKKVRAAIESFTQVSNLDEILRQYTAFTESLMNGIGPMKGRDSVKMKFPFPGVTALKGQVVEQSVKAAKEDLEIARREAVSNIRTAFWNLLYIRKARSITSETVELFRRLESAANTRYKAGKTSFQDVIKVTIKTKILEENLITLREKQRNLENKIFEILNLPPGTRIGTPAGRNPGRKIPSLKKLYAAANENRQELRRMRAMIAKMERMVEMAETMILPPFTLNLSIYEDEALNQTGSAAMKPSFPETTTASMGAGLPKNPWFGTNDAWLNQTRQTLEALKEELKKGESGTNNMVRGTWFALDKAIREEALYRNNIVGLSQSALDVSTRGYESGTVSFADVIGSYTDWLNVSLSLARKQSDIGAARAELERVVGRSL